ncbi:uncharacterized protein (TIGR02246 family) [Neobacillus niacini]|uniref:nuclear transport factor 2 family protein n=1 Tax=Neobacillus niacini TaxID=86668 RepID=UPI002860B740|nr:nuclear transport factor 2 family protein [Neobacillus niacini]MDR7075751.1 uncharacterized protein (TIGR02246 family) [Neobacillus niacini]
MEHLVIHERIHQLEAIDEIRKLIANYCHGVDKRDRETFLSIWHEEGVWVVPKHRTCSGKKEIESLFDSILASREEQHHHSTNSVIEVNGDYATAISDVVYTYTDRKGKSELLSASYRDEYTKKTGKWLLKRRELFYVNIKSPLF